MISLQPLQIQITNRLNLLLQATLKIQLPDMPLSDFRSLTSLTELITRRLEAVSLDFIHLFAWNPAANDLFLELSMDSESSFDNEPSRPSLSLGTAAMSQQTFGPDAGGVLAQLPALSAASQSVIDEFIVTEVSRSKPWTFELVGSKVLKIMGVAQSEVVQHVVNSSRFKDSLL
jgi:hypothetical protein